MSDAQPVFEPLRVDAGGRRLAASFGGRGEPVVILETGFGAPASGWRAVAEAVAAFSRVGWYDRAGRGGSDPAERPRTPAALLADLDAVVDASGASGACVLVGQSFGGLMARLYAASHPRRVAGLVLVDSLHEEQFATCAPLLPPPSENEPAQHTALRRFWSGGWRDPANNEEGIDMVASLEAGRRIASLGALPIRVLTATTWTYPPRKPPAVGQRLQDAWDSLQARFERLGTNVRREGFADTGHFVQLERPEAVVRAIRDVVSHCRGVA